MGVSPRNGLLTVCLLLSLSCAIAEVEDLTNAEPDAADRVKRQVSPYLYQQYQNQRTDDQFDRRAEESWWQMYGYGERFMDDKLIAWRNREFQINLGFDFPYYGFRFNYTQIHPGGFISFAMPSFNQPPFTFPNPRWPLDRDHSFIAPFYADAAYQFIGETQISNVWYRTIHRPKLNEPDIFYGTLNNPINRAQPGYTGGTGGTQQGQFPQPGRQKRQMPSCSDRVCQQIGRVIDPETLDNITRDIQEGIVGADGWRAEFGVIITWERMAYGGAPKMVDVRDYEKYRQWQNTYQLILATDEIRSYVIFNYARLNWTTSNEAGGLNGFGGKQAAMVGFNGGNGTGFTRLPYSGEGRVWKLSYFTNVLTPGRWIYRIDEEIISGGCSNESTGYMVVSPDGATQLGGVAVNVSGPCLRDGDFVKVVFEEWPVDCKRINRIRARCVMPMFHKTGLIDLRMSRDGGQSYPYIGWFYVLAPQRAPAKVLLRDDVENQNNRWMQPLAEQLSLEWQAVNLTYNLNARTDINLWGYYEDVDKSYFYKIDTLSSGQPNNGFYQFSPKQLQRNPLVKDSWKYYRFGFIQVAITQAENEGVLWSGLTPFGWYHLPTWQYQYGSSWATDMCIEWYEYDGKMKNFIQDMEPCPCRLEQALLDLGRFMPIFDCDRDGDTSCPFHKGAYHCVMSVQPSWLGAQQQCCYDQQGYLMFTDDWEITGDYNRFFNPASPVRAHNFGAYPYKQPPRIPGLSNYMNDLMPFYICCQYAQHCEFYYWRRQTHGCQDYGPPAAAYMWGEPHVRTYQSNEFTFPGKGYYVLAWSEDPHHRLMVQGRLEQPPETLWHSTVNGTIVTGIAIKENDSDVVQIFSRYPEYRDWRYKTDVYVNGIRRFFDKPRWKLQQFRGLSIRNPQRNMNQSELIIMLDSGAAIQVQESFGMLDVMILLPPTFNATCDTQGGNPQYNLQGRPCYVTKGLMGAFTGNIDNDMITPEGTAIRIGGNAYNKGTSQMVYEQFGLKWRLDDKTLQKFGPVLFQDTNKPIYNPLAFANPDYIPEYWPDHIDLNATLIFNMNDVLSTCMGDQQCQYDYILTGRREIGLNTLDYHKKFMGLQQRGSKRLISCGPLLKSEGVIKTPVSQNYLSGDVVTFSCKPDYFLHGDEVRICQNGTWTSGWWVWCRDRNLEYALRWVTGILCALAFLIIIIAIFCCMHRRRVALNQGQVYRIREPITVEKTKSSRTPQNFGNFENEPARVGLATNGNGKGSPIIFESSA